MTDRSPSAETIRFVIEILSARATPVAELPETIAAITQAVTRLGKAPAAAPAAAAPIARLKPAARKPRAVAVWKQAVIKTPELPEDVVVPAPVEVAEGKPASAPRRGRPRRVAVAPEPVETEEIVDEEPPVEIAPPQPRLLRRAEALASESQFTGEALPGPRAPEGTLRGVVKWFDNRAGKGALRLTGISGDVMFDPTALAGAGVKRLYKDQEIEATVEESGGRVRLLSLSIPARSAGGDPLLNLMPGEVTGTLRRQPHSVQVQVKRDGVRQSAARAEAEQVLGGVGRIKATRRLTP